jgi:precorrin-2 dehydrogenase/sirohydrochlorin ferrochelatase
MANTLRFLLNNPVGGWYGEYVKMNRIMSAPGYPIFLQLKRAPVLIVGGGNVALRKARSLTECDAAIAIISPHFNAGFDDLPHVRRFVQPYAPGWLGRPGWPRWKLVFAATDQVDINQQVLKDAQAAGMLCCRCDEAELGDFISPAAGNNGSLTLAVSTHGASPALAARICHQLLERMDPVWSLQAQLLARWRVEMRTQVTDAAVRRELLELAAGVDMEHAIRDGGAGAAQALFVQWIGARAGNGARENSGGDPQAVC